jgi:bifunctional non-homologous end joining protein LigD
MLMRSPPLARERRRPPGFIVPCQPTLADKPPSGPEWIHELKCDGFRMIARRDGESVRIWSRNGRPWTREFPRIAEAVRALPCSSIVLDGEAICDGDDGRTDFGALLSPGGCEEGYLTAFDLLMLGGKDLRTTPLEARRASLAALLSVAGSPDGIVFSEAFDDGAALFRHACRLGGIEGIVSKRRDRLYRSGRSSHWLKVLCPDYERRQDVR